jgi:hypothetical protein
MAGPNDAFLVRVTTRELNGTIEDLDPLRGGGNQFDVIVEGEAGAVKGRDFSPYRITVTAFDFTAGNNLGGVGNFTQSQNQAFDPNNFGNVGRWPNYQQKFTVTINNLNNVQGHLLKYYASLISRDRQIISFVESPLFILQSGEV